MFLIIIGGEDDLALKIESVIEGCNDVCLRSISQERTKQQLEDQLSPQTFKRKRLSEAVLSMQYPCQASFIIKFLYSFKLLGVLLNLSLSTDVYVLCICVVTPYKGQLSFLSCKRISFSDFDTSFNLVFGLLI